MINQQARRLPAPQARMPVLRFLQLGALC